jgi:peroxiredoxin
MNAETLAARSRRRTIRPGSRLANLAVMAVTGVVIVGLAFLTNRPASASGVTPVDVTGVPTGAGPVVGRAAPDLAGRTLDGKPVRLSDFLGSPVWLTFGASWCQPCRAENPDIRAAYDRYRERGLVVVQVFMSEDASAVSDYAKRVGIPYVTVPDPDTQLATEYRILGIPSHFFIDRSGVLQQMKVGSLDPQAMDTVLDVLTR